MPDSLQAILFDLDGTLLDINMNEFLPHYFQALAARVAHLMPPDPFMQRLRQATQVMVANDGRDTNAAVFAQAFYPVGDYTRQDIEALLADFYAHDFPKLRRYARHDPHARPVVQAALDKGYDVVIATNPLFPATAVQQRIAWAGVDGLPYRWISTFENSRAAKPNLLYYEQILDMLDCPAENSMMVGDEDMDMVAAHLGCRTFLVPGPRTDLAPSTPQPDYRGTLADLYALLQG